MFLKFWLLWWEILNLATFYNVQNDLIRGDFPTALREILIDQPAQLFH